MCRVFCYVVGRGCLLWPAYLLGKTLFAFALLHFVLQGQTCLIAPGTLWPPTFAFQPPLKKRISFIVLVLEFLVALHKTIQLQLLWHLLLGHRLGLLWCRVACLGNEPRSHCFISAVQYCSTEATQVALVVKSPPAKAGDLRDAGSIPGSGRSPGGGHSNPLHYPCLENPMNGGAWWAAVHRVTELDLTEATEHKQFYK